jgi:hypothetical protein
VDPFQFIQSVILLCAKHRGSVSSWGRTPKHNKDVGGVENSIHQLWLGCDVVLDDMKKWAPFEKDAELLGLIPIFELSHYHLQPASVVQK